MHPRANGQAERTVRTIKEGLRRLLARCDGGNWWDLLPDVVRAIRLLPKAATGHPPYVLAFKQLP